MDHLPNRKVDPCSPLMETCTMILRLMLLGVEGNDTAINHDGYTTIPMLFTEGVVSFGGIDLLPGKLLIGRLKTIGP